MKPRWKRCVESTDQFLGEALGQKYVEKYFPPEAKARMQEMVRNLLAAMRDDILSRPWMSDDTKEKAMAKIATFNPKIGYPDKWKDYSHVEIRRDAFFEDMIAGRKFVEEDDRATIGKPVDRGRWGMTPPTSDAYYNPLLNEIVFPAGILQPPAFDMNAVDAVNYGAIGVVIGHEISHGFDDQGAQYDYLGRLRNWWTDADLKDFQARAACVADQFDHYYIEKDIHHNGKLVLGESIGDLGGAKIAYLAYQKSLEGKPRPADIDGFTPEQQFFIAWGQFRGDEIRPEAQRLMVQSDPHPIAKYRVIGPLSNLPEFQKAWSCKADAPMVRPEGKRCDVWSADAPPRNNATRARRNPSEHRPPSQIDSAYCRTEPRSSPPTSRDGSAALVALRGGRQLHHRAIRAAGTPWPTRRPQSAQQSRLLLVGYNEVVEVSRHTDVIGT